MKTAAASVPIFRSDLQARLHLRVLIDTEPHTAAELARLLQPRADRAPRGPATPRRRLLTSSAVGRANVLKPADHNPATAPLRQLLTVTYGPAPYLERALSGVPGIQQAAIYGSWAALWHSELGPTPGDVDVLVVGSPNRDHVYDALEGIDTTLGREVNVTLVSPERWASGEEKFLAAIRDRPMVPLHLTSRVADVA